MNRTDRLLALILELQSKKTQRAEDLAATFETSKRTIYRDIQALMEAGVPIISQAGIGYSLVEGYFLPPLSFTQDEATMLLLGADLMADSFDTEYRSAAQRATTKIATVLPPRLTENVRELRESIRFIVPEPGESQERQTLQIIRRAILHNQTIRFMYHTKMNRDGASESNLRDADPYRLTHIGGVWHLTAYCHLRKDTRNFRLSRIDHLQTLARTFTRPDGFKPEELSRMIQEQTLTAEILFDHESARWLEEDTFFYIAERRLTPEGMCITLKMRLEKEVLNWLMSWGPHVLRIEPESLRKLVIAGHQASARQLESA